MLYDETGCLRSRSLNDIAVFIDGRRVYPDELGTPVDDGDELDIMYVISGG